MIKQMEIIRHFAFFKYYYYTVNYTSRHMRGGKLTALCIAVQCTVSLELNSPTI